MKKYLVVFLLLSPFLFSSCLKFENIELISVKDVTYLEFRDNVLRLAITATINNPNKFKVKIKDADMELRRKDRIIGSVTQMEQIELDGKSQKDYKIKIAVEIKDVMSGLTSLYRMLMNDTDNLNLSGSVHVKSFIYSKTYQVDKLSFRQ